MTNPGWDLKKLETVGCGMRRLLRSFPPSHSPHFDCIGSQAASSAHSDFGDLKAVDWSKDAEIPQSPFWQIEWLEDLRT